MTDTVSPATQHEIPTITAHHAKMISDLASLATKRNANLGKGLDHVASVVRSLAEGTHIVMRAMPDASTQITPEHLRLVTEIFGAARQLDDSDSPSYNTGDLKLAEEILSLLQSLSSGGTHSLFDKRTQVVVGREDYDEMMRRYKIGGERSWALSAILAHISDEEVSSIGKALSITDSQRLEAAVLGYAPDLKQRDLAAALPEGATKND